MKKKLSKRPALPPLLPGKKQERRRVELLGGAAVGIFALTIVAAFALSGSQQALLRSPNVAAVVSAVLVDLANRDRAEQDLDPLAVNPVLVAAAQAKANDMAEKGYFSHVSPEGLDPWHWFREAGYTFTYAGENLAVDFSDSGDVNTAWMNSPTHRKNILDPHFVEIGIATAQGMYKGRATTFVVQEFGAPSKAKSQGPVRAATVPIAPTTIAVASTKPAVPTPGKKQILGTATQESPVQPSRPEPAVAKVATTEPALAASLAKDASDGPAPFWAFLVGFPRDTLRYIYYLIGGLILIALAVDTELEFRWHHRKRAAKAGLLLVAMAVLFFAANFFFAEPTLAAGISLAF